MSDKADDKFAELFDELKTLIEPLEPNLVIKTDEPGDYYLNTHFKREDGYVYAFGGVQVKKNYVSYHLMPVYAQPDLLDGVSDKLKKRMQGKSCFNFTKVDKELFAELDELTQKSFEVFKGEGFIE